MFDEVDDIVYAWENFFNTIVDLHCPWHEKRLKQATQPLWMMKDVINQLRNRHVLLNVQGVQMIHMTGLIIVLHEIKLSLFCVLQKREFFKLAFEENINIVGAIWKTIKTLTGTKKCTIQNVKKLIVDGRDVDNTKEVAEKFNSYFCSIADKLKLSLSCVPLDLSKLNDFV